MCVCVCVGGGGPGGGKEVLPFPNVFLGQAIAHTELQGGIHFGGSSEGFYVFTRLPSCSEGLRAYMALSASLASHR